MARQGKNLENLVANLERATHDSENVTVESPKMLVDTDTGKLREHDVVLTFQLQHHEIVMAIECRDRTKQVGVPEIEAFSTKCNKTGIDRGVIVSSSGFYKSAITKASALNIGCLQMEDVSGFNWCLTPGMETSKRFTTSVNITVIPDHVMDGGGVTLFRNDNVQIEDKQIREIGLMALKQMPYGQEDEGNYNCVDRNSEFYILDENAQRAGVKELQISITYATVHNFVPFEFHQYFDAAKGTGISEVASASIDMGRVKGKFMIVQNGKEDGSLLFVPDPIEG